MILDGAAEHFQVERLSASCGIAIREHRYAHLLISDGRFVLTYIGGISQYMRCAITIDVSSDCISTFVVSLDGEESRFWEITYLIYVDHLVMNAAQKH